MLPNSPPIILTIAGSDSGGGAGIQADLKTFAAHGCYGMSVITALTAQNTMGVRAVMDATPEVIGAQMDAVLEDIGCDAVKIGMLSRIETVVAVADALERHGVGNIVLDPVMISKSGHRLLGADSIAAMKSRLFPIARLITPNLPEVEELTGFLPTTVEEIEEAARRLGDLTPGAVLVKGGHMESDVVVDVLWDGSEVHRFESTRLSAIHTHGTGCTLSAAIACQLGLGHSLPEAVDRARHYLLAAIKAAYPIGQGIGPVNHLWPFGQSEFQLFSLTPPEDPRHG